LSFGRKVGQFPKDFGIPGGNHGIKSEFLENEPFGKKNLYHTKPVG
jgi:hypothetical protein